MFYDFYGNPLSKAYTFDGSVIVDSPYLKGASYPFSSLAMTDSHNVIKSTSAEHIMNANSTLVYNPSVKGNANTQNAEYEWVDFACNIKANKKPVGVWIYIAPDSCTVYGGKSTINRGLSWLKIKINGSVSTWEGVKAGLNCYIVTPNVDTITSVSVGAIHGTIASDLSACMYLDSVEVGFGMAKPHIMFNLDCVPSNFYSVGYPLFEKYGLKCTLQYPISSTSASVGANSDYWNASIHNELKDKGYDFATYSGWQKVEAYGESIPFYDDESKRSVFASHAERLWNVNGSNMDRPSCVHSTGFLWGNVAHEELIKYGFKMVRQGNTSGNNALFSYYDTETRAMIPYFIENVFSENNTKVTAVKNTIDRAIATGQNLQIGFHQIMGADYDTSQSGANIYVGVNGIESILAYVKQKQDAGQLICCTTSEFWDDVTKEA